MKLTRIAAVIAALSTMAVPALAHPGHAEVSGLVAGLLHPFTGWDHAVVMLAIGVFAMQLGGRALLLVPASFMAAMMVGAAASAGGVDLPMVETGIAISVLAMGIVVAMGWRMNVAAAMGLVAGFALFHGAAHAAAMPATGSGLIYAFGFVAATAALHGLGLALGFGLLHLPRAFKPLGILIAAAGFVLLAG